jgi:2-succinyl-6-hydroxy-2,4-cyclohexadiene-1-carboxylate synthase
MPDVRVGDVSLHVTVVGEGEPLMLLHGFTGSGAQWAPQVEAFAGRFRTIAVDLLGHGRSDAPADPERYRMGCCVADLRTLVDALGIERACWLGYSMGARVALAFALAHPGRVRALVLEGIAPGIEDPFLRRQRIADDETLADRIERDGVECFVDEWMRQPLFASQARLGKAFLAAARAARCANSTVGLANALRGMGTGAQEPLWGQLSTLTPPTLLVVGEEDMKFRAITETMALRTPRATIAIVPQAGHATHLENATAFNARVLRFLTEELRGTTEIEQPATSVA